MQGISSLPQTINNNQIGIGSFVEQAQHLASYGRNGDVYVVHAAEGETVVPMEVFEKNPKLKEMVWNQIEEMGLEPERYVVGNELNSINPVTGQPEFFLGFIGDAVKGIGKILKPVLPVLGAVAGSFIPGLGAFTGPALGSFLGGKLAGQSTGDALKGGIFAGLAGGLLQGSTAGKAGGYKGNAFTSKGGPSLGSSLFSGAKSQGLGSLLSRSAPSVAGVAPSAATAVSSSVPASSIASGTAPAVTNSLAAGAVSNPSVWDKISKFATSTPGLILGGTALVSALSSKSRDNSKEILNVDETTGLDLLKADPVQFGFNQGNFNRIPAREPLQSTPVPTRQRAPQIGGPSSSLANFQQPYIPSFEEQTQFIGPDLYNQTPQFPQIIGAASGGEIVGPGSGTSDDIPAMLSDGEFVITAAAVRGIGGGSRQKGAKKLYRLMKQHEGTL